MRKTYQLKTRVAMLLVLSLLCLSLLLPSSASASSSTTVQLWIGNATMSVNGVSQSIDTQGTRSVISGGRTLLPIRSIIEAFGGSVAWEPSTSKITVTMGNRALELWLGKSQASLNGAAIAIDSANSKVVPVIVNGRTMLPLRFVAEAMGLDVQYDATTKKITLQFQSSQTPLRYINPQKYSVKYSVIISNTGFSLSDIKLYLPLPGESDAQKDLSISLISPEPKSKATEETSGNSMLYWQLIKEPKKDATTELSVSFDLTVYETITDLEPSAIQPYNKDSIEVKQYTKAENYIEANDPDVVTLANTLSKDETNPCFIAKGFYDYIIDNAEYKLLGQGLNGAKYLLDHGYGECGDYSALFIALCRAKGIPARPVVGFWAVSGNDQTHVWAEFYLEGIGWIPVDATIGQQSTEKRDYYFGNMDNQRVILSKGYNIPLVPSAPDGFIAPILQVPWWWFWGSGEADKIHMDRNWVVNKIQ